jgi:hypothetical protein
MQPIAEGADQSLDLAKFFQACAESVDDFRGAAHDPKLTDDDIDGLVALAQGLTSYARQCNAESIREKLDAAKGDLAALGEVTKKVTEQFKHVQLVQHIVTIGAAVVEFGFTATAAALKGDIGGILSAGGTLESAIFPKAKTAASSGDTAGKTDE